MNISVSVNNNSVDVLFLLSFLFLNKYVSACA